MPYGNLLIEDFFCLFVDRIDLLEVKIDFLLSPIAAVMIWRALYLALAGVTKLS